MNCPLNGDCIRYFVPWRTFNMIVIRLAVPILSAFITGAIAYVSYEVTVEKPAVKSEIQELRHKQAIMDSAVIRRLTEQSVQFKELNGRLKRYFSE